MIFKRFFKGRWFVFKFFQWWEFLSGYFWKIFQGRESLRRDFVNAFFQDHMNHILNFFGELLLGTLWGFLQVPTELETCFFCIFKRSFFFKTIRPTCDILEIQCNLFVFIPEKKEKIFINEKQILKWHYMRAGYVGRHYISVMFQFLLNVEWDEMGKIL